MTVTFDVIKGRSISWPRIESDEHIVTVGGARPMENAARIAYSKLVRWLAGDHGFDTLDAHQLLTQVGELYVGNMVDTTYSLVARYPKRYLNGA